MEDDTFPVDANQAKLISENKKWIEYLFRVELNIYSSNDQDACRYLCKIVVYCEDAQEILVKTKKYLSALIDDPEASVKVEDANFVAAAVNFKEEIERTFAAPIIVSDDFKNVTIRGDTGSVTATENLLFNIQHWCQTGQDLGDFPFAEAVQKCVEETNPLLLAKNAASSEISCGSYDDRPNTGSLKSSDLSSVHSQFNSLALSTDHNTETSSDDEDVVFDIKNDPLYQSKVEFALKLGYLESDLVDALKNLGKDASQNELLSELIKNNAGRDEQKQADTGDLSSRSQSSFEDDLVDDVAYKGQHLEGDEASPFRHIIMDGSNVAMSHGSKEVFSCRGIQLAVDWFQERGHTNITVFVPQWRKETSRSDARIRDQHILTELEKAGIVVFTPSRRIGGKRVVCYDDRYILKLAVDTDGIVVSNDNYRDLMSESDKFKKVVEERLLMYSFVNDRFMPPDDPLGRNGPTLDNFLLKEPAEPEPLPPPCPYGSKKCTYGNKCKYYHPERRSQPHKLVTEKLAEQAKQRIQEIRQKDAAQQSQPGEKKKLARKSPLQRTQSHNPQETSNSQLKFSFGAPQKKETDEKYREYNQKLTESRLKMEQEREQPNQLPSPRTPEKKELQRSKTTGDQTGRSSPRFTELRQDNIRSPRGSSPVNLSVPGNMEKSEGNAKFLSGHLLLAKKLSDEANESDKLKKKSKNKVADDPFGSNTVSPLAYSPSKQPQNSEPAMKKQPLQHKEKQSLSRQRSAHTSDDPRLATGHGHQLLHPSFSSDPRLLGNSAQSFIPGNIDERQLLLRDFQQVQHQELTGNAFGPIEPPHHRSLAKDLDSGHTALARMQSAPDPFTLSKQSVRQAPMMMRQNSSSDTQLNKLFGGELEAHPGNAMLTHGSNDSMSSILKDTAGAVRFQIGGVSGQAMQSYKPSPFLNPLFSPNSRQEFRFHQQHQFQTDFQQQGTPFIPAQPLVQGHPQGHPHPCPSPVYHTAQNVQYMEQPANIWEPPQPNVSNFLPHSQSAGSLWPSLPQSSPTPAASASTLGPSGQIAPYPIETPILRSDRRFKLYCDLCRLFPEEKVRAAMNQHPNADNANDICPYLIVP